MCGRIGRFVKTITFTKTGSDVTVVVNQTRFICRNQACEGTRVIYVNKGEPPIR